MTFQADMESPVRGLSTARSVLKVLTMMSHHPDGLRAAEVASMIHKSASTAYYLLASLVAEGFAEHCPDGRYRLLARAGQSSRTVLAAAEKDEQQLDRLFAATGKRCYVGCLQSGHVRITADRGRQGLPRIPGLSSTITTELHALALGKVVLAELSAGALGRYGEGRLKTFTPATITEPQELWRELERVRDSGIAISIDEFHTGFSCMAVPMRDSAGRFLGVLGLSTTTRSFHQECGRLTEALRLSASKHVRKTSENLCRSRAEA